MVVAYHAGARETSYAARMKLTDKVIVVTGGAHGIGAAMLRRFHQEKPRALVVADRDQPAAEALARELGGVAVACDVSREAEIVALVERATKECGAIDLFVSNAGIAIGGGIDVADDEWRRIFDVNLMAHVWAARALLPAMVARKSGYLVATASAAGLLSMVGSAPYSVTKHAAVALAEWLAITYGDKGIKVSCLCPLYVNTDMLKGALNEAAGASIKASGEVIEPAKVADAVVDGIDAERFLILPHPEVATYFQRKAGDYDRWLAGMRKLHAVK
jgi:NAD(P)-dependent dehydrogenase (short-subunit alcohol dehydrogenase family)